MAWIAVTDGKGVVSVIQADDPQKAEKIYRKYIGEANYTYIEVTNVIRVQHGRTQVYKKS